MNSSLSWLDQAKKVKVKSLLKKDITIALILAIILGLVAKDRFSSDARIMAIIHSDSQGYYQYLPALFISAEGEDVVTDYHSIPRNDLVNMKKLHWSVPLENGNTLNLFQYGTALLQLPFFLIAHLLALAGLFPVTGYNTGYFLSVVFATLFYGVAGIVFLKKALSWFYSFSVSWLVGLAVFFGTSAFYYTSFEPGMSHVYSFFCTAGLLYGSGLYYEGKSKKGMWIAGLFLGLLFAIRPYNLILGIFPLLWNVSNKVSFSARVKYGLRYFTDYLPLIILPLLLIAPQLIYWKIVSGDWILFSYGRADQGFIYWDSPFLFSVLFSIQNGFITYAPVMILALTGLIIYFRKGGTNSWPTLFVFLFIWYLFASWWAWWFGGAFGHRAFVDYLPVLAFPLAALISSAFKKGPKVFLPVVLFCVLSVFYTVRLSFQYVSPWDGENWTTETFLREVKTAFFLNQ